MSESIMQVGQIYEVEDNSRFYWVCVEKNQGKFRNLPTLISEGAIKDGWANERQDESYLYLMAIVRAETFELKFFDKVNDGGINHHGDRLIPSKDKIVVENRLPGFLVEMITEEKELQNESKKQFVYHIITKNLYCVQDGKFVTFDNEIETRELPIYVYEPKMFKTINISYEVYLELTGLKQRTKETELKELKEEIFGNNLGCQKDALTPVIEDFLSLCQKLVSLKEYRAAVKDGIETCMKEVFKDIEDLHCAEGPYFIETTMKMKRYIKRLKRN